MTRVGTPVTRVCVCVCVCLTTIVVGDNHIGYIVEADTLHTYIQRIYQYRPSQSVGTFCCNCNRNSRLSINNELQFEQQTYVQHQTCVDWTKRGVRLLTLARSLNDRISSSQTLRLRSDC